MVEVNKSLKEGLVDCPALCCTVGKLLLVVGS